MFRVLKPFAAPVLTFLIGTGLQFNQIKGRADPMAVQWASGFLIGLAVFWIMAVALSHKALLRRFPSLAEWLPFLDMTGGFANADQLRCSYVKGQHFRIAMLAENNEIQDRIFEDCVIYGPAVLIFSDYCQHLDCRYDTQNMHWEMKFEPNRTPLTDVPVGAITLRRCVFKRCAFSHVGFVGTQESIKEFNSSLRLVSAAGA